MYSPGQVVYDLQKDKCVVISDPWDTKQYPEHNAHLICVKHKPVLMPRKPKTFESFKCYTCGNVDFVSPKDHAIYTGSLKNAKRLIKAGLIKPVYTLKQSVAQKKKWLREQTCTPANREAKRLREEKRHFDKSWPLKLRFATVRGSYRDELPIKGRDFQSLDEYRIRDTHNLEVLERANKEYLRIIDAVQKALMAKYNPLFTTEDPKKIPLDYNERKAVHDRVWRGHNKFEKL